MTTTPTGRDTSLASHVAAEIRAEMGRQRITQSQLARKLNVTEMWLSRRLREILPMDLNDLYRIAAALNIEVRELLPRGPTAPPLNGRKAPSGRPPARMAHTAPSGTRRPKRLTPAFV